MVNTSDFKTGLTIELDGDPCKIVDFQHVKPGKGAAFVRTKLKNVETGNTMEKTFRAGEKFPKATLEKKEMQYLYKADKDYIFMDNTTYDQVTLTEEQIGDEVARIIAIYDHIYSIFGLNYAIELSTRPEGYIGDIESWNKAEEDLKKACLATGHPFKINPGDGAFYGPKLDFKLRDSMNRIWQCGTVQLDMQLPDRFNCFYIAEDGTEKAGATCKNPVMIDGKGLECQLTI